MRSLLKTIFFVLALFWLPSLPVSAKLQDSPEKAVKKENCGKNLRKAQEKKAEARAVKDEVAYWIALASQQPLLTDAEEQDLGKEIEIAERKILEALVPTKFFLALIRERVQKISDGNSTLIRETVLYRKNEQKGKGKKLTVDDEKKKDAFLVSAGRFIGIADTYLRNPGKSVWREQVMQAFEALQLSRHFLNGDFISALEEYDFDAGNANREESWKDDFTRKEIDSVLTSLTSLITDAQFLSYRFVEQNLLLVVDKAKRMRHNHPDLHLSDLIAWGNLGLFKAAQFFDYRTANRFSTYALPWIRQTIDRGAIQEKASIWVPNFQIENFLRVLKKVDKFRSKYGRELTEADIEEADITTKEWGDYRMSVIALRSGLISMSQQVGEDGDSLGDLIDTNFRILNGAPEPLSVDSAEAIFIRETIEKMKEAGFKIHAKAEIILNIRYRLDRLPGEVVSDEPARFEDVAKDPRVDMDRSNSTSVETWFRRQIRAFSSMQRPELDESDRNFLLSIYEKPRKSFRWDEIAFQFGLTPQEAEARHNRLMVFGALYAREEIYHIRNRID